MSELRGFKIPPRSWWELCLFALLYSE